MGLFNPNPNDGSSIPMPDNGPIQYPAVEINSVIKLVYMWMGLGLLTTAVVAWFVATNDALLEFALRPGMGIISLVVLFGCVIVLNMGLSRPWLSPSMAAGLFFTFAAIEGFLLSVTMVAFLAPTLPNGAINPNYDPSALYAAAGTAAALFGSMTLVGFTTKMDLTKWGTYLFMGLIGLIIAMVVNLFLGSDTLGFVISVAGVLIFTALTAYDTQKIKRISMTPQLYDDSNLVMKFSILGALILYLDLLNLFLFLLQLFGGGRD